MTHLFSPLFKTLRERRVRKNDLSTWESRRFESPSPPHIKRTVLKRLGIPNALWIETGTFMGDTCAELAEIAPRVITLEPDQALFQNAERRFKGNPRVEVVFGTSESKLPSLLQDITGPINFWLDGHYSGGITHRGQTDCPVFEELKTIQSHLSRFTDVCILIDDIRCFDPCIPDYSDYPKLDFLVDWARSNGLKWSIEHDIFCMKRQAN